MENMIKDELEENKKQEIEKNNQEDITDKQENKEDKEENENKEKIEKNKDIFERVKKKDKNIEKEIEEMNDFDDRKKWVKPVIIISIILILGIIFSTIFSLLNMNSNKIMSGTSISNIDVSGLTKEEAILKLNNIYDEKKEKEINVIYNDYETSLNPKIMEVNYEIEKAVDNAYSIGRENNIFINNYKILSTLIMKKNIEVNMTINEEVSRQAIEDIGVNLPGVVVESTYSIEDDELIITKGKEGVKIDTDKLLSEVKEKLKDTNIEKEYIEIPVINKKPETIDIDKIYEEIHKEPQDAYYTKNPFTVYPEVEGVDFDLEEARKILAEEKEEYVIKLTITKPKVTINQIGTEAFPDKLSTFTTRYDASDTNRTTNLVIACNKINEKVILPGETFSYNETLGPRTAATGYKNAKVYEAGQVVDGIGGGICQISSTLYNAVLTADLKIVERRNHQFVTSYVPAGRDATVVYGLIDFKFKNTRKYPIRIVASAKNGIATVSIFGIKEENEYTFSFSTKTVASIPFTTKYIEDSNIEAGKEKVKQKGANGLKTETYITKILNGKAISTTLLSKDTYDAMTRIVIKGTKGEKKDNSTEIEVKPEEKPEEKPSQEQPTENEQTKPEETKPEETTQTNEKEKEESTKEL